MAVITYEQVSGVADRLAATGKKISVAAVRSELGGGSMSTLGPLVKKWKDEHAETNPVETLVSSSIIEAITQIIDKAIRDHVATETSALNADAESLTADLTAYQAELQEKDEELASEKSHSEELSNEVARLKGALEEKQKQYKAIQAQLDAVTVNLTTAENSIRSMQSRVDEANKIISESEITTQRQKEAEEKIRTLEAQNTLLQQDADELRQLRQERPVLQSKADRYDELKARHEQEIQTFSERLHTAQNELASLRERLGSVQDRAQNELNTLRDQWQEELSSLRDQLAQAQAAAAAAAGRAEADAAMIAELREDKQRLQRAHNEHIEHQ